MTHAWLERDEVNGFQPFDVPWVVLVGLLFQEERAKHRHDGERKNERPEERERNREGERTEHLSFEALEVKSGRKTMMIMKMPKTIGRPTSLAE